jgi:uncharacterized membrane protein
MRIGSRLVALAVTSVARVAVGEELTLRELPGNITEGTLIVDAPPDVVYAHAVDYENWANQFSDIRSVSWESGDRDHARVRFKSLSFGQSVTVLFDNVPGRLIRFHSVKAPPGGRARGEYLLTPIDGGRRTAVTARLYMDVVGPPRLLFSADKIRTMRHAKLQIDLQDTERWFDQRSRT